MHGSRGFSAWSLGSLVCGPWRGSMINSWQPGSREREREKTDKRKGEVPLKGRPVTNSDKLPLSRPHLL
jgi:hypothetical protein